MVIPIFLIPYLIKHVGVDNVGQIYFSQAFINYFVIFTDYGFNLSGTRRVSINRDNNPELSKVISTILSTKALLGLISIVVIIICVMFIRPFNQQIILHLGSITILIGSIITPTWFFQGIEKMRFLVVMNFLSKILTVVLILIFIRSSGSYQFTNLLFGLGTVVGSFIGIIIMMGKYNLKYSRPSMGIILIEIRDSWNLFLTNFFSSISVSSNLFILGFFGTKIEIGYFSVAEKIYFAFRSVAGILYQATFPKVCMLAIEDFGALINFLKNLMKFCFIVFFTSSIGLFIFSEQIITFVIGSADSKSILFLKIISFAPAFAALSIPPSQYVISLGREKLLSKSSLVFALFSILVGTLMAKYYSGFGTSLTILLSEFLYFILILYLTKKVNL